MQHRSWIVLAPALLLASSALLPVPAQQREIDLAWIRSAGSRWDGVIANNGAGRSVAPAGDVNDDGRDDFLVAAYSTSPFGDPGSVYLVYGRPDFSMPLSASLSAADVVILGTEPGSRTGQGLGAAGDVNGDGFDDVFIGAPRFDITVAQDGRGYILYGGPSLPAVIDLASLPSAAGVVITGAATGHQAGASVAGIGRFNDDLFDDVLLGAPGANTNAGAAYIVYGGASLPQTISLGSLTAGTGVTINGIASTNLAGTSVAAAGDFNDDGFHDALIGAPEADPGGEQNAGQAYVVFGGASVPTTINLAALGGAGFVITGQSPGDELGFDVDGGGDVNGDGIPDVIVGAKTADTTPGGDQGKAYIVYGSDSLGASVDMGSLGSAGVTLNGASVDDEAGTSVAMGGDFNRDGLADVMVGAQLADPNGSSSGEVYLLHGSTSLPGSVSLGAMSFRGVQLNGLAGGDLTGVAVAAVGDVNNDSFDDFVIGARQSDPPGFSNGGRAFLVLGACSMLNAAGPTGEGQTFTLTAHGPPGRLSINFLGVSLFPSAVATGVGPFWIQDAFLWDPLFLLDADGQWSLPITVPTGIGLSGNTLYWQTYIDPQPPWCDITQVLATPIP